MVAPVGPAATLEHRATVVPVATAVSGTRMAAPAAMAGARAIRGTAVLAARPEPVAQPVRLALLASP
jgi:hypothetical protein